MKLKAILYACTFAVATGLGIGISGTSTADPGCAGDCFAARYECYADCATGSANLAQCRAACQDAYQACLAACG